MLPCEESTGDQRLRVLVMNMTGPLAFRPSGGGNGLVKKQDRATPEEIIFSKFLRSWLELNGYVL